jgi:hypothetical protein
MSDTRTVKAAGLTAGDLGLFVGFDFNGRRVNGELREFGVPDNHPSLWSNPIMQVQIVVERQEANWTYVLEPDASVAVATS